MAIFTAQNLKRAVSFFIGAVLARCLEDGEWATAVVVALVAVVSYLAGYLGEDT